MMMMMMMMMKMTKKTFCSQEHLVSVYYLVEKFFSSFGRQKYFALDDVVVEKSAHVHMYV